MVTKSITFNSVPGDGEGEYPPPNIALVELEQEAPAALATDALPKSVAFPVDAMVT